MNIKYILIIIYIIALLQGSCNVWDNIFSHTQASSPIILSESFDFKFPMEYQGLTFDGYFDYNHELNTLCIVAEKNLIITKVQAGRVQIDLDNFLVTVNSPLRSCEKVKLALDKQDTDFMNGISFTSKLFLINIFFEYIGRNAKDNTMSQYRFMPDLIFEHTESHEQREKNIIVVVDSKGSIKKIYEDQTRKKELSFSLKSKVTKKLDCPGQVKEVTKEEIYQIVRDFIDNRDYEKVPGWDQVPEDKKAKIDEYKEKLPKQPKFN